MHIYTIKYKINNVIKKLRCCGLSLDLYKRHIVEKEYGEILSIVVEQNTPHSDYKLQSRKYYKHQYTKMYTKFKKGKICTSDKLEYISKLNEFIYINTNIEDLSNDFESSEIYLKVINTI